MEKLLILGLRQKICKISLEQKVKYSTEQSIDWGMSKGYRTQLKGSNYSRKT